MGRPSTMPEGTEQKLIEFVELGLTDIEIAVILGKSRLTIIRWRKKFFISKPSSKQMRWHADLS